MLDDQYQIHLIAENEDVNRMQRERVHCFSTELHTSNQRRQVTPAKSIPAFEDISPGLMTDPTFPQLLQLCLYANSISQSSSRKPTR